MKKIIFIFFLLINITANAKFVEGIVKFNDGHEEKGLIKSFLEDKWYLKVPGETVHIKKYAWRSNSTITNLFRSVQDFIQFVKENPKSFKITITPPNFNQIKQKVESVGGELIPQGEIKTYIRS